MPVVLSLNGEGSPRFQRDNDLASYREISYIRMDVTFSESQNKQWKMMANDLVH